jgi:predicted transcriptional regulator
MKKEFYDFVNALIAAAPETAEKLMTENIKNYIESLTITDPEKPEITDNGKVILDFMQKNPTPQKSRDIAEGLFTSSRTVSGAMRKLVTDGFVMKSGENPIVYALTEKGKNYNIV